MSDHAFLVRTSLAKAMDIYGLINQAEQLASDPLIRNDGHETM